MKCIIGIVLLLLVVTTKYTRHDHLQSSRATFTSTAGTSVRSTLEPTSSATSATATEAPLAAAREASLRLPDAIEERDGRHPESDNTPAADGQGTRDDVSRGKTTAPSGSTAAVEELGVDAAVAPESSSGMLWLPSWCRHWMNYGPLPAAHDTIVKEFAEALVEYTVRIGSYLVQTQETADIEEKPRTKKQQTHLVYIAVQQVEMLKEFYKWMYQQLNITEANDDFTPESIDCFLDALENQVALVETVCNLSPSISTTCKALDSDNLQNFFMAMNRQSSWVKILHRWAASFYNLTAGPRRHPYWWLPTLFDEDTQFNVSHSSKRIQIAGDSASGVEAVSNSICTIEDSCGDRQLPARKENSEDVSSETTGHRSSSSVGQLEPQDKPHKQEGTSSTPVLQSLSTMGHETEHLKEMERDLKNVNSDEVSDEPHVVQLEERPREMEVVEEHKPNVLQLVERTNKSVIVAVDEPRELQLEERTSLTVVVEEFGEERDVDSTPHHSGGCSETAVLQELGLEFDPYSLVYVKCDDRDGGCPPPEKCLPLLSTVTVAVPRWRTLPSFPHTYLASKDLPDGRVSVKLLVPTACTCIEPLYANTPGSEEEEEGK